MKHLKLKISGRVQGVFFRKHTKKLADELGVFGWVKNNNDGSVSVEAEGEEDKLISFADRIGGGAEKAVVQRVERRWDDSIKNYSNFEIII